MTAFSDEQLVAAVDRMREHVLQLAQEGEKQIRPFIDVLMAPDDHTVVQLDTIPGEYDDKTRMMRYLGQAMTGLGIVPEVVLMCTEAWMSLHINRRPSTDPDRIECVVVSGLARDGRACGCVYELRRKGGQRLVLIPHAGMPLAVASRNRPNVPYLADSLLSTLMRATGATV